MKIAHGCLGIAQEKVGRGYPTQMACVRSECPRLGQILLGKNEGNQIVKHVSECRLGTDEPRHDAAAFKATGDQNASGTVRAQPIAVEKFIDVGVRIFDRQRG